MADRMMKPGLYQIRVFYGEDKMDFDGLSLAKMLPAEEALAALADQPAVPAN